MKEKKRAQLKRVEELLKLSSEIKLSAESLQLISEGYGDKTVYKEKLKEITEKSKHLSFLLNTINSVEKNGEDHHNVLSC
jgi:hypothetical protein